MVSSRVSSPPFITVSPLFASSPPFARNLGYSPLFYEKVSARALYLRDLKTLKHDNSVNKRLLIAMNF